MKWMKQSVCLVLSCVLFTVWAFADDSPTTQTQIATEYMSDDLLTAPDDDARSVAAPADFSALKAKSFILMEQDTGKVLAESNADQVLAPASVTKVMSLLLIMEALEDGKLNYEQQVSCSEHAASMGGSQIWLEPGESMTVEDLIKAVAIGSANDATVALGEAIAGSEENFVSLMNDRASQLGMTNTHFVNCSGLDAPDHHTTARDIAIMSRALMKHENIKTYSTVWMDALRNGKTQLVNTNKLVRFYNGATGLKTGTTDEAGCCLSATATRDGLSLIAVVMGCPTSNDRFQSAKALLNYGFANYEHRNIPLTLGEKTVLPVTGGTARTVKLRIPDHIDLLMEKGKADPEVTVQMQDMVEAPIKVGETVGRVEIKVDGNIVAKTDIIAETGVDAMTWGRGWLRLLLGLFHA